MDRDTLLTDLFGAYFDARRNKRNTLSALRFELEYERHLVQLCDEILDGRYAPGPSICFVVDRPVKREIFAAMFRDRVVHHLIFNYISPVFERLFINDCYSCRPGKGTGYGIERATHFIRSCTRNYTRDAFILKLDIKGYFMAMDRNLLFGKVESGIMKSRLSYGLDTELVLELIRKVIFNDPRENCVIRGSRADWEGLPRTKSLFHAREGCGLPIGNLTSQLFGNIYLNDFDHFVKRFLKVKYYGRYVDDMVMVHPDKEYLKSLVPLIRDFLGENARLMIHPDKIYMQHYTKGVKFLGAVIKPYRTYIGNRTKGSMYRAIDSRNSAVRQGAYPSKETIQSFTACMNSYLGIMGHYDTYRLRRKMLSFLIPEWMDHVRIDQKALKLVCKQI